jgi:hypothetical protein
MQGSYDPSPILHYVKKKGYAIQFYHVPTDSSVAFPAFLTSFTETYNSNWNPVSVFGRMDPIYSFQQTSRSISFAIDIPSADVAEAKANLESVRFLTKFLYPTYQNKRNATTISKAPLIRIKFVNLIGRGADGNGGGLLGKIQSVNVNPDIQAGFFDPQQVLYPKILKLDITLDVIHESNPGGWSIVPTTPTKKPETKPTSDDPKLGSPMDLLSDDPAETARSLKEARYNKTYSNEEERRAAVDEYLEKRRGLTNQPPVSPIEDTSVGEAEIPTPSNTERPGGRIIEDPEEPLDLDLGPEPRSDDGLGSVNDILNGKNSNAQIKFEDSDFEGIWDF